ncbi:ABC transporter ATP-binding protein [Entomospira entomophila]|uniref:ABC transporter ATP-binding protein n=1 Tax=Entomospira entomophila TaxID=2719988 RepID=A0A968GAP5_9SPIO|nr:ABC transporter ATP-binding protein [Entomospira entomophilus]NIZ40900.1 ABC transporter ATP-binding protein [Entomospira entomophilus]WDI35113.1 ABC transporter ATP-binding protein [Entomospira entomophilus]
MDKKDIIAKIDNLHINIKTQAGVIQAVRGVSLDFEAHKTIGLIGESGSGKSMMARTLLGLLPAGGTITSGHIYYNDAPIEQYTQKQWRDLRGKEIAMIFQDPMHALNPLMTIGKQLSEAIVISQKVSWKVAKIQALDLLEKVGLEATPERYHSYPHQYSGGMRQRIAIAMALSCKPKLLICDEPTTALDVSTQAQIIELIINLQKEYGMAILFISHDLSLVSQMADEIAIMYAGRIVEHATTKEIFLNPKHPYTWALLSAIVHFQPKDEPLYTIEGAPPLLINPPKGDLFAYRSEYALDIDFQENPPFFGVSPTHRVASWLQDPRSPTVTMPALLKKQIEILRSQQGGHSHGQ